METDKYFAKHWDEALKAGELTQKQREAIPKYLAWIGALPKAGEHKDFKRTSREPEFVQDLFGELSREARQKIHRNLVELFSKRKLSKRQKIGATNVLVSGEQLMLEQLKRNGRSKAKEYVAQLAARGNAEAAWDLYQLALNSTLELARLQVASPSIVEPMCKKVNLWPVLEKNFRAVPEVDELILSAVDLKDALPQLNVRVALNTTSDAKRVIFEFVGRLDYLRRNPELLDVHACSWHGRQHPLRYQLAGTMMMHLGFAERCLALKELNSATWEKWFALIKDIIMVSTRNEPQKIPAYRKIGQYRELHKSNRKRATSVETNIRDGLFTRLKRALKSLVTFKA
jgi:hypothetical protein